MGETCEPSSSGRGRPACSPRSGWPGADTTCAWSTATQARRPLVRHGGAGESCSSTMPIPSAGRSSTPLAAEMPDVLDDLTAAGATVATLPGPPAGCAVVPAEPVRASAPPRRPRRSRASRSSPVTSTRWCRSVAAPRASRWTAAPSPVTSIIDASGRASRFTGDVRPPAQGGDCGAVYVTRQYRLRHDAAPGPVNSPIGLSFGLSGLPCHRVRSRRRPLLDHVHPRRQRHPAATTSARRGVRRRRARHPEVWRTGSNRHGRNRSRPPCPAGACTTPTEGNSTRRAGRCCPVWSRSETRCAPPPRWPEGEWRWR